MLAVNEKSTSDFDPLAGGVHSYRFLNNALRFDNPDIYLDRRYFKFTVIRDPYSRLLSAYLDKIVKPLRQFEDYNQFTKQSIGDCSFINHSFKKIVHSIYRLPDYKLERHWKPQHLFFRNIKLDHVGRLDKIENTYKVLKDLTGIDVVNEVYPLVHTPKRTLYSQDNDPGFAHRPSEVSAFELSRLSYFPPIDSFLTSEINELIKHRFADDWEVYNNVFSRLRKNRGVQKSYRLLFYI
jgi:hypothetical protein